jgi:ferrous iron transport protein B
MRPHNDAYAYERTLVDYGVEVENEIARLQGLIEKDTGLTARFGSRWLAIKLLEEDEDIVEKVLSGGAHTGLFDQAAAGVQHLAAVYGDDVDTIIADRRYGWIHGLVKETVQRTVQDRLSLSDKIDRVATNRVLGIPIFVAMMWIVFKFTTDVAAPYLDWVDGVIGGPITNWIVAILGWIGLGGTWVESLFVDGIVAGVGGIMVFMPVMMSMYIALAVLEDSGYMARAAFVMDRLMHALGLHGKSFLPMMVGFGCTVPAFYATRTLANEKDRILTGLLVPFMSCGARLPVYVLVAAVFFPESPGAAVFWMYIVGIIVAVLLGVILKNTLFKGKEQSPFVMELPPYRLPTLRSIWLHMWERSSAFLRKAWGLIMVTSVVIWVLLAIPVGGGAFADTDVSDSLFAAVSRTIAPVFRPAGFGDWSATGALMTGFVAKEVVVGTMAQIYDVGGAEDVATSAPTFFEDVGEILSSFVGATWDTIRSIPLIVGIDLFEEEEEEDLTELMVAVKQDFETTSQGHGKLAGLSYMLFVLLYTPCMVAVAAERQELGNKWTGISLVGQSVLAWIVAVVVFQGGLLLNFG